MFSTMENTFLLLNLFGATIRLWLAYHKPLCLKISEHFIFLGLLVELSNFSWKINQKILYPATYFPVIVRFSIFSRELNLVLGKGVMCVKNIVNWLSFPHLQITKSKLIGLPMTISVQLLTTLFLENYITSISNPPGLIPFWIRILSTFYLIPEFKLRKLKYQMNLHMNYPSQMMLSFHQIQFLSTNVHIL